MHSTATLEQDARTGGSTFGLLRKIYASLQPHRLVRLVTRRERRLRLCETLPLGERRLLALVQFDRQHLLVGVTGTSITLLTPPRTASEVALQEESFDDQLRRACGDAQ